MNIIVFDLEATTEKNRERSGPDAYDMECVELGAVKLNENGSPKTCFQGFIKPVVNTELSEYCKNITHISQEDIDKAPPFKNVIEDFQKWIGKDPYLLLSWGFYDFHQLIKDCKRHDLPYDFLIDHHSNLKRTFAKKRKMKQVGVMRALKMLKLDFNGQQHRALDDAINTSRIFNKDREYFLENSQISLLKEKSEIPNSILIEENNRLKEKLTMYKYLGSP